MPSFGLSIPYGKHPTRGNISPDDDQDGVGQRCNVQCLGCKEPLEHRRKSKNGRRAHYAHWRDSKADIAKCRETAIHMRVKDMLASKFLGFMFDLPEWHGYSMPFTPIRGDTEVRFDTAQSWRGVDVMLWNSIGQRLAIEVFYSHRKQEDEIADYRMAKLPTIEMPVSDSDIHINERGIATRIKQSEWIVDPFEPFECSDPPMSSMTPFWYRGFRNAVMKTFDIDNDRHPVEIKYQRTIGDLTCWIIKGTETPHYYLISKKYEWLIFCDQPQYSLSQTDELLDHAAKSFKYIQTALKSRKPALSPLRKYDRYYKEWDFHSTSVVADVAIMLSEVWSPNHQYIYKIEGTNWKLTGTFDLQENVLSDNKILEPVRRVAETLAYQLRGFVPLGCG